MKNDFKYIIKRIIVGVAIGMILFNLKSCNVNAETVVQTFAYTATPSRCRAYNGSSWSNGTIQQATERGTFLTNWCSASGFNPSQVFFPYSQVNTEIGKNYNVTFSVFATPWSPNPGGEITKDDLSSIVWNMSTSVGYATDVPCDYTVGEYIFYEDNNGNIYYGYQYNVKCKNVTVNPTYGSFNIKLYQNNKVATSITRTLMFQEIQTTDDIISSSDTSNSFSFFNQISIAPNSILTQILTIPIRFYGKVKAQINTNNCVGIELPFNKLPLSSYVNYDRNLIIPCFRDTIENDLGFTYYETIGTICGGALLLVYVMHRGKGILKMSVLENNDDGVWGGLS